MLFFITNYALQAQWTTTGTVIDPATLTNNVSIGTNINGANLFVQQTGVATLGVKSTSSSTTLFLERGNPGNSAEISYRSLGTTLWNIGISTSSNFAIRNITNGAEPFRILQANNNVILCRSGGNVGIATDVPSDLLQINHTLYNGGILLNNVAASASEKSEIKFNKNGLQMWGLGSDLTNNGSQSFFVWNNTANKNAFFIDNKNYVGIDNQNPNFKFDVNGNMQARWNFEKNAALKEAYLFLGDINHFIKSTYAVGVTIGTNLVPNAIQLAEGTGNVGIGVTPSSNPTWKLRVDGGIAAREVKVTAFAFPDFVFEPNYKILSIPETENYIQAHKHLPGIPSAAEVEKNNGIELGNMQLLLLQKIEELTLYIIQQQKEIDALKTAIKK